MPKSILFVHGAWASSIGFNYIHEKLKDSENIDKIEYFDYDTNYDHINDVIVNISNQINRLAENGNKVILIGHSLGGVISLSVSMNKNVDKAILVSAPISGIKLPIVLQLYKLPNLIKTVAEYSAFIANLKTLEYTNPIVLIASVYGYNLAIHEPNDGIITVKSQLDWTPEGTVRHELKYGHHEILQSDELIEIIQNSI
jgi:pimeloyl-ACP methyl ester carboxylesterase